MRGRWLALVFVASGAACGTLIGNDDVKGDGGTPPDSSTDDGRSDGGSDAPTDGGTIDAAEDSSTETGAAPMICLFGVMPCEAGTTCCVDVASIRYCPTSMSSCVGVGNHSWLPCSRTQECPDGLVCCYHRENAAAGESSCKAQCATDTQMCDPADPKCPGGTACDAGKNTATSLGDYHTCQ
jgi:hypothetical protein